MHLLNKYLDKVLFNSTYHESPVPSCKWLFCTRSCSNVFIWADYDIILNFSIHKKSADLLNSFQDILHSMYINLGEISVGEVKSRLSGIPAWHWMERAVSWLGLSHLWFIVVADLEISDREDGILRGGVSGYCYIKGEISIDLGEVTTDG